ncbi:hypothetical protein BKA64DRAFT_772931 [Cadophora sp. MPI-SDFR-AT-0126]|nr:hypothetical protein BKA64DRAFT_772931 [Leotiomycetes sp. MPI-SDFR-AT-0126]
MGSFLSIIAIFGLFQRPKRLSTSLNMSPFRLLPNEIILQIGDFLQPSAGANFALTCLPIYRLFTNSCRFMNDDDKLEFLELLERDLPNHIVCQSCIKLHSIKKAHKYVQNRWMGNSPLPACRVELKRRHVQFHLHKDFSLVLFQMAMKLNQQGRDASRILGFLSSESGKYLHDKYLEQYSSLARVVDNRLLLRDQRVCKVPTSNRLPREMTFWICPHFWVYSGDELNSLDSWRSQLEKPDPLGPEVCHSGPGLMRCLFCYTDFRLDFKSFGDSGNVACVTTWKDLGSSRPLLNEKWQSHLSNPIARDRVEFERGSICSAFEGGDFRLFKFDNVPGHTDWMKLLNRNPYSWSPFL